ncbi:MAG TPA: ATP-binding protein [Steroidobacteraceae bacterium]|jgi:signal transduction histidine kinase
MFNLWPRSLFGRLVAASVLAVLLAQVVGLFLLAHERETFVLQESVREWSRRIAEVTFMLQPLTSEERVEATNRIVEQYSRFGRRALSAERRRRALAAATAPEGVPLGDGPESAGGAPPVRPDGQEPPPRPGMGPAPGGRDLLQPPGVRGDDPRGGDLRGGDRRGGDLRGGDQPRQSLQRVRPTIVPFPLVADIEHPLEQALLTLLGNGFHIQVTPAATVGAAGSLMAASIAGKRVIPISPLISLENRDRADRIFNVTVGFPDGDSAVFRLTRPEEGAPLPRNLFLNLILLVVIMAIALFATARSITLPLSRLARAADSVGRDLRQPKLQEKGPREVQDAARAFNTMQDRLQRYLDSRTRVLAAMSHDLKTPLTRLRLQVETLDDADAQTRIGKQLDEMESMVRGALALFRGLDDDEAFAPVNINALLATLESEFTQMGGKVTVEGTVQKEFVGKPQALKRCLTNLIENAIKFGGSAALSVQDGASVAIRVVDSGPGIPPEELERVFEPFYRVESSRNRDTGGTGLGLSIARDIAQAHGGSLSLTNLPERGLEALLILPRQR